MNKRRNILKLLVFCLAVIATVNSYGQDASFSQYYSSELYLNPAFAGVEKDPTFSSNYRSQWRSIHIPYVTSQFSFIYPFYSEDNQSSNWGGAGISFYNDKAGAGNFKTIGVYGNIAYNLSLSEDKRSVFTFALQGGLIQKNVDYTNLEWGSQYNPFVGFDVTVDPGENNLGTNAMYPDIGAGVMFTSNQEYESIQSKTSTYAGISAYHLNVPNESFVDDVDAQLPMLFKFHGGLNIPVTEKLRLSPNLLGMYQNDIYHLNGGLYAGIQVADGPTALTENLEVLLGAWYRYQDAYIASIGLSNPHYTVGFSYDYNSSDLRFATRGRGAYEVSLTIHLIQERDNVPQMKRIQTPRI